MSMATEPNLKVKLVKCPKCWKVLPLFPELRIYKCGGCGTLLQAKSQQNSTDTSTGIPEATTSKKNIVDEKVEFLPSKMNPLEMNDGSSTIEPGNCTGRQLGGVDSSYRDFEGEKSDWIKQRELHDAQPGLENQLSEEKMNGVDFQENSKDTDDLQPGVTNLSHRDMEDENEETDMGDYSPSSRRHLNNEHPEVENLSSLEEKNRTHYTELRECIGEQQKYSNGVQHKVVHLNNEDNGNMVNYNVSEDSNTEQIRNVINEKPNLNIEDRNNQKDQHDYGDSFGWHEILDRFVSQSGLADYENEANSSVMGVGDDFQEGTSGGSSPLVGAKSESILIGENEFNNGKTSTTGEEPTVGLRVKIHAPADVFISDSQLSSPSEQLEHSQRSILDYGLDAYAATEYADHSSEFSGNLGDFSNSRAIRRPYIYNDSDYHNDRTYYQQYNRHSQPLQVTGEVPDFVLSTRRVETNRHPTKPVKYRSAELQGLAKFSTSMNKKPDTIRNYRSGQLYTEPRRHLDPLMDLERSGGEHYPYEMPLNRETLFYGCESVGPSNLYQQDFGEDSGYPSPDRLEGIKQVKKQLLRTVSELEDQLNQTQYLKGEPGGGAPSEVVWPEPWYHHKEATEGLFQELKCATSPRKWLGGSSVSKGQKLSQIPYSGQITSSKRHIDESSNYSPRDWRYSAPLPSRIPHQKFGLPRSQLGYSPYSPSPSSPQLYPDSNYSLKDSDLLSIDPRSDDYAIKRRVKVESNPNKQHFLPTAGGAPFIACYSCLNLLQLPADLLLFKRKSLRIKCGSCSKLLKFSFLNKMHVVPYLGNINSPLHEVDSKREVNKGKSVPLTSHSSMQRDMAPVSYSDDNEDLKEADVFPTASYSLHGNASKQRSSYSAPLEPKRHQGKSVRKQFRKKCKDAIETFGVSSPSPRSQSDNISPLHRLLGYASPKDMIYGHETSAERTSSNYAATQDY